MLTYATEEITPHTLQEQSPELVQQQRLRAVGREIRRTLDLSTVLGTTVVEIATLFGANQVVLIQSDWADKTYQQVSRYCQNQSLAWQLPFTFRHTDFSSLLEWLWQGQPLGLSRTGQSADDPRQAYYLLRQDIQRWQARWLGNWLLIPVENASLHAATNHKSQHTLQCNASQYWGILALALPNNQTWSTSTVTDAQSIATELASAIAHSIQHQALINNNQALQKLALSDGLTSIANRRRFDEYIEDEWQRLTRDQQPLSLILCDIDEFKLYNDTLGHPAGDRCLIHIARALLKVSQRPADLVARYGGEEFAIVLPNTDTHGAWRVAQNIHTSIRKLQIAHAASSIEPYLTVTLGIATVIPGPDSTPQTLLQASDIALYYAKQQGRNRTYINGHHNTIDRSGITPKIAVNAKLKLTPNE